MADKETTRQRFAKARVAAAWRGFYETPEGKIAILAMMRRCGIFSGIEAHDPVSMALHVGERNMCAWVAEMVGLKPEDFVDAWSKGADFERRFSDVALSGSDVDSIADMIVGKYS